MRHINGNEKLIGSNDIGKRVKFGFVKFNGSIPLEWKQTGGPHGTDLRWYTYSLKHNLCYWIDDVFTNIRLQMSLTVYRDPQYDVNLNFNNEKINVLADKAKSYKRNRFYVNENNTEITGSAGLNPRVGPYSREKRYYNAGHFGDSYDQADFTITYNPELNIKSDAFKAKFVKEGGFLFFGRKTRFSVANNAEIILDNRIHVIKKWNGTL